MLKAYCVGDMVIDGTSPVDWRLGNTLIILPAVLSGYHLAID
jgi:hypothetical protein